ncbi:hypothetical protein BO70DRAFT_20571 [Aspergillus heteromorphus CBS 117.55]|uniref:Uncharacterized protein n=1 Tax=Aspergillus heteromorphus CBS 117.55 TaxID=1448321 RepID=A0A317X3E7_9EURO|nr:uncharacterized protein BO70DRAFT_20571 [Aspergillus heteromorphus CBS 117.55]PWY92865.1 hypothetical protein BO70DRAFT_20571 [Aspergillus heteromorphus CBS 117.55]
MTPQRNGNPTPDQDVAVQVEPVPVFGPRRQLPTYLLATLEKWHREHGNDLPACKCGGRAPILISKVFDRQGRELELARYTVVKPRKYDVLVLHEAVGTVRFVLCDPPQRTEEGTFLRPWSGSQHGDELQHCAVRVFGSSIDDIVYSDLAWDYLKKRMAGETAQSRSVSRNNTPPEEIGRRRMALVRQCKRTRGRGGAVTLRTRQETSSRRVPPPTQAESSLEEESSDDEEKSVAAPPPAKKPKAKEMSASSEETKPVQVVFRVAPLTLGKPCRNIPLEACRSRQELFKKAQDFYRARDKNAQIEFLDCQIESPQREAYCLVEDSDAEFLMMVEQAQSLKGKERVVVNVVPGMQM